jgi:hypothetical protein
VLAGQVTSAINELIHISEFVPAMAEEAATIIRRLAASLDSSLVGSH